MNFIMTLLLVFLAVDYLNAEQIEPLDRMHQAKGDYKVPTVLKKGIATRSDVDKWTKSIRENEEMVLRDINGDGIRDVLSEIVGARGATGNRAYLLFLHTKTGYKFLGIISNLSKCMTYDSSGNSYILTHSKAGGPHGIYQLHQLVNKELVKIGNNLDVIAGDSGTIEGNIMSNRLRNHIIDEDKLVKIFKEYMIK